MNKKKGHVFVWPISTRMIHWIIAFSFIASFSTSFTEQYLHYHVAFGWIFGVMLGYRILWGLYGPRYATFSTFRLRLSELSWYFKEKVQNRWRKIPAGHNPASSWFTIIVLLFGSIIVLSGLLLYGVQEGKGIFSFLNDRHYTQMFTLGDIHIYTAYFLTFWTIVHVSGVLVEQFYHKTGMLFAMITGYKKTDGEDTDVTTFGLSASYTFIFLSILAFYYIVISPDNFFTQSKYAAIDYKSEHPLFYQECGDCHKTYPPFMLPHDSWERLMDGLDEHFNERITELNISKSSRASIRAYLYANSAEHSSREIACKMLKSIGQHHPISTSKVIYWRETHADIDSKVYKRDSIKSRANCSACHKDFESANMDDVNIHIPE